MKRKNRPVLVTVCSIVFFACGVVRADDVPAGGSADVTKQVQQEVAGNSLTISVNNEALGDPAPTLQKKLRVDFTVDGVADSKVVMEGGTLEIHPHKGAKFAVTKAVYGDLQSEQRVDVTKAVSAAVQGGKLNLAVGNETLGGDPAPTIVKKLEVSYTVDGKPAKTTANEFDTLVLPSSSEGTGKLVILSATYGAL